VLLKHCAYTTLILLYYDDDDLNSFLTVLRCDAAAYHSRKLRIEALEIKNCRKTEED